MNKPQDTVSAPLTRADVEAILAKAIDKAIADAGIEKSDANIQHVVASLLRQGTRRAIVSLQAPPHVVALFQAKALGDVVYDLNQEKQIESLTAPESAHSTDLSLN